MKTFKTKPKTICMQIIGIGKDVLPTIITGCLKKFA